jgi:cytochrome c
MRDHYGKLGFWSEEEQGLVRPEIYSMGHRNPFSLALHPVRHYPAVGEAGWDNANSGEDEINLIPRPQNHGWPFFNGGNSDGPQHAGLNPRQPASAPMNLSKWNTGVKKLPPAVPAAISNRTAAVRANLLCLGTVLDWVRYVPGLDSKVKFPPYLDGKLLFTSFGNAPLQAATVDDSGRVTRVEEVLAPRADLADAFRAETGPDGALYIARGQLEYGVAPTGQARIVKLTYAGSCAPIAIAVPATAGRPASGAPVRLFHLGGDTRFAWPEGTGRVRAYGVDGALAWEARRAGSGDGTIPTAVPCGMLRLRFFP